MTGPATSEWKPAFAKASLAMASRLAKNSPARWQPAETDVDQETATATQLFESLAAASTTVAQLSMHLRSEWRLSVLAQLKALLSIENWDDDSNLLNASSVRSFLRFVIYGDVQRAPSLGINNRRELTATWLWEDDRRVFMDFGDRDSCRAVYSGQGKFGQIRQAFAGKVGDAVGILSLNGFDLTTN